MEKAVGQSSPLQEKLIQVAANVEEMVQEHLKVYQVYRFNTLT